MGTVLSPVKELRAFILRDGCQAESLLSDCREIVHYPRSPGVYGHQASLSHALPGLAARAVSSQGFLKLSVLISVI